MKKLSNTTKVTFILSFSFMLLGAAAFIGLVYVIEKNAIELRDRVSAIAYSKAQQEERYETQRVLEETKEERAQLSQFVLTENSVVDFITGLETQANALGLEFNTQAITPEETKDPLFDELSMKFNFSGSQVMVERMIAILETIPHLSYIRDISIRQNANGSVWETNVVLVVTILTYDQ